jgi:hypothetical protein
MIEADEELEHTSRDRAICSIFLKEAGILG